eukprot:5057520-Amphidinium_carterae.2
MEEVLTSSSEDSSEPSPRTKRSARKPWMRIESCHACSGFHARHTCSRSMTQQAFDSQGGLAARCLALDARNQDPARDG